MSLPDEFPIAHKIGDTFAREMVVEQRESESDSWVALDLTGYEVELSVAQAPGRAGVQYLSTDSPARVWVEDAAAGKVRALVPASETRAWSRYAVYEVTLESAGGVRFSILDGPLEVRAEVIA